MQNQGKIPMGTNSLRDLKLAGIKWELVENLNISNEQTKDNKKTANKPNVPESVIPAVAPIIISAAQRVSKTANNLSDLSTTIESFDHPLRQFVKNTILPHFTNGAELLIITDVPSGEDDENGMILSGGAGDLINKMISAIGLSRDKISILPLVFWRTPGGRTPTREDIGLSKPFVTRAISLLKPKVILTLGTLAATEIANAKLPKNHGDVLNINDGISAIPIYHPNYILLKPDTKQVVWAALQKLQNLLKPE